MIKFVLMDVEGTTTDIRFVKNELFPYAFEKMGAFVAKNFAQLSEAQENLGVASPSELSDILRNWITEDKKEPQLKSIQGKIWLEGYENGELKGHVYDEVPEALKRWREQGLDLGIYSSGSVAAQKLLYKHSVAGDLTPLLSAHFDLGVGKKFEETSYRNIVEELGLKPEEVLFLSDIEAELDAASAVGLKTTRLFRDDTEASKHLSVSNFDEIDFTQL